MVFNFDSKNFIGQSAINNRVLKDDNYLEGGADITIQDAGLINIFNLRGSQRSPKRRVVRVARRKTKSHDVTNNLAKLSKILSGVLKAL